MPRIEKKPLDIRTVKTLDKQPWSVLLYGLPKAGKTVMAATAPKPLLLEVDVDGEISLHNHPELHDVAILKVPTFDDVVQAVQQVKDEQPEYQTVIIDTISTLQEVQRLELIDKKEALNNNRWVFNQNIFSINNFKVNLLIKELLELKKTYNIVLTAHLKEDTIGTNEKRQIVSRPDLSPNLMKLVNATVNGIFVLESVGGNRVLTTKGNRTLLAESRYKIPEQYIKEPTFTKLRKYLDQ